MAASVSPRVRAILNAAAARDAVESIIVEQQGRVDEAFDVAESSLKSGAKEYPKHLIERASKPKQTTGGKLFGGIGTNIGQDWLKSKGGFGKFLGWMWEGAELGSILGKAAGGGVAWPIAIIECGSFALELWEEQIKISHARAVEDLTKEFDRVVHVHTEVARKLQISGQNLLKTCEAMPARIISNWSKGAGQKALQLIASRTGNPIGRKILIGLTKKTLLNHLMELDAARYELYLLGTNCHALVVHGENVSSDSSNAACGFPEYAGYRMPQRGRIIQSETSRLTGVIKQCDGCETRLSNVAFNLWSLVGYQLGMKQSEASSMGF